jgi:hypothetical protein
MLKTHLVAIAVHANVKCTNPLKSFGKKQKVMTSAGNYNDLDDFELIDISYFLRNKK